MPDECVGLVDIFSEDAWVWSGGPSTVESPIRDVRWKCGSYRLAGHSRKDATEQRAVSVTVTPKGKATVDIRGAH
jgi:hypothetical protein